MKRIKIYFFLGLFLMLGYAASAAQVYILFDPACMDRLEFKNNRPDGRSDYLVYHINIRSGEKLILEIGEESGLEQNYLPETFLSCSSGGFDQGLMRRINANIDEIYLVYTKNNKNYTLSPVATASYYTKRGSTITYESPKYNFRFDTEFGTIGENIAVNNPGTKVYFEGKLENGCTGSFLFRQLSPQSAYPLTDLIVTPEIGIVEERSGANASAALNNSISIDKINGKPAARYLQEVCGTEPGSRGSMLQATANTPTNYNTSGRNFNPPPGNLPAGAIVAGGTPVIKSPLATNTSTAFMTESKGEPTTGPTTHTVARGETLYKISGMYEVSVEDIKKWNNLSSSTIRRGQVLNVVAPGTVPSTVATTTATVEPKRFSTRSGNTTLSGSPVPYGQSDQRIMADNANMHIVRPGETVASLALEYGYTTSRFRQMNDLGPNDYVRVGQRLKTTDCDCDKQTTTSTTVKTPTPTVPNSYNNSTGGRIVPNNFNTANPTIPNQVAISPNNSGTAFTNAGGLPSYSSPVVPANTTTSRGGNPNYNSVVPSSYETTASSRSMSSLENNNNRAIGSGNIDFGEPISTTAAPQQPSSYGYSAPQTRSDISPYPTPNTPISYDQVARQPDSYYQGSNQRRVHIVSSGESLYGIARRYGTSVEQLRKVNNLGPNDPIIEYQSIYLE